MSTLQNIYSSNSIDDNFIISLFYNDKGNISNYKSQYKWLNNHKNIHDYLLTRYSDSESIKETLYRIKNSIEIRPTCKTCGNPVKFDWKGKRFNSYCCNHCATINKNTQERRKNTCIKKYGVDHPSKDKMVQEKIQNSTLKNHGYKSVFQDKNILNKALKTREENWEEILKKKQNTLLKHYGVKHQMKSEEVKNKIRNTCISIDGISNWTSQLEKSKESYRKNCIKTYGVDNPMKNDDIKQKIRLSYIKHYGVDAYWKSKESKIKWMDAEWKNKWLFSVNKTKRLNNTFNTSKAEDRIYNIIMEKYPDVIRQYRSELYPFNCDFYIPSLDLYIEYNGHWTHGKHKFNPTDENDIKKLNNWKEKSKTSKFYKTALYVWTDLDIRKRNIAKENNLNYIEIWDENIDFLYNLMK